MTCSACKYEFCWLCGREMRVDHYFDMANDCFDQQFIIESDYTGALWTGEDREDVGVSSGADRPSGRTVVVVNPGRPRRDGPLSRFLSVFSR